MLKSHLKYLFICFLFFLQACSAPSDNNNSLSVVTAAATNPQVSLQGEQLFADGEETISLKWSADNVEQCTATGGWSGNKGNSGEEKIKNPNPNKKYSLKCVGDGGVVSDTVDFTESVLVPELSLSVSPGTVESGSPVTLVWAGSHVESCVASGDWSGSRSISGTETIDAIEEDSIFILSCTGAAGDASDVAYVDIFIPDEILIVPTVNLQALPSNVEFDGSTTLTWSSTDADSCSASGDWTGSKSTSGSQAIVSLTSDSTFILNCTGSGGTATVTTLVTVDDPVDPPTVSIWASSTNVDYNGSTTLNWTSSNTDSCTASGDWSGEKAVSGSQALSTLIGDSIFVLTCAGVSGNASGQVNISVAEPALPTLSFSASSTTVAVDGSTTLSWSSSNTDSCVASGDWSGSKSIQGSMTIASISTDSQFILTCSGNGGTVNQEVTVAVVQSNNGAALLSWNPPTENTDNSALTDLSGYKIYYGSSPGNYSESITIDNPGLTSFLVEGLANGTWYFSMTSFNSMNIESAHSNEVSKSI